MSRRTLYTVANFFVFLSLFTMNASAQQTNLGSISFPNSGNAAAQADFIDGSLFLHSFEYEQAADAYRRAQEKDPSFALAFWGEAMTYNHPVWMQQDRSAALEVLNRLAADPQERASRAVTEIEKDFLRSVEILYGTVPESADLSKEERDDMYAKTMGRLHVKYPDDHEVAAFHALSLLGTAHEGREFATYMKAAAAVISVWDENRNHPGAAHYLIHSFDDPIHAPLGLPMASAYSVIAPNAAHAQHMTSHIFVALGLWDDVVSANIVASRVQNDRNESLGRKENVCGHYTSWLQYGYLQTGEVDMARQMTNACFDRMSDNPTRSEKGYFARMRARFVFDTEDWNSAETFALDDAGASTIGNPASKSSYEFTSAVAGLMLGDQAGAVSFVSRVQGLGEQTRTNHDAIYMHQLQGLLAVEGGDNSAAENHFEAAVDLESSLPFEFGPPPFVKPTYELL